MQIILSQRENLREDKIEHLTIFWFSFELICESKSSPCKSGYCVTSS